MKIKFGARILFATCSSTAILAFSQSAFAACDINPTLPGTVTTCTGAETNGVVVQGNNSQVVVEQGATVSGPDIGSIVVRPAPAAVVPIHKSTITIQGSVIGGSHSGIHVTSAAPLLPWDNGQRAESAIIVAEGGLISGTIGIDVTSNSSAWNSMSSVTLTNSGTISGSSGLALRGNASATGRFASITNTATGVIGAISAQVGELRNAGLIDGGSRSAYTDLPGPLSFSGQGTIFNTGTIRSSGPASTIFLNRNFNPGIYVDNSGLIENLGTGSAIEAASILYLANRADGTIRSDAVAIAAPAHIEVENHGVIEGGQAAIRSQGRIVLTNRGTIKGDVNAAPATSGNWKSIIDNRGGTIDGDVRLGGGDDVFIGDIAQGALGTVTGTVDAGRGVDSVRYIFSEDTTLTAAPVLPTSFERFEFRVANSSTLILGKSFAATNMIAFGGGDQGFHNPANRLINRGRITTTGSALVGDTSAIGGMTVVNEGTIEATLTSSSDYAVALSRETSFTNSGSIAALFGNGVHFDGGNAFANTGTITASGVAASTRVRITNSGTLRSTGGLALDLYSVRGASTNSGTIDGAVAGVRVYDSTLVNSGTISAADTGVEMGNGSTLVNQAGGIISGGTRGIGASTFHPHANGASVFNAGTINGDVAFGTSPGSSYNVFVARSGSVLNGDLFLGSGNDSFVTTLANSGPGAFAGVTGTVTGTGHQTIRYIADATGSTTLGATGIFGTVGYELTNGAALTVTALGTRTIEMLFAGNGTVDLAADLNATASDRSAINMRAESLLTGLDGSPAPANAVRVTSRGTITKILASAAFSSTPAIAVGTGNTFENAGTIVARGNASSFNFAGIAGSGTAINSGAISLDSAIGIYGDGHYEPLDVVNSGSITQAAGGGASRGIVDATTVTNSGMVATGGDAIVFKSVEYPASLANSGDIISSGGIAVSGSRHYTTVNVTNAASGTIAASSVAIALLGGGIVDNAGTIVGDVRLGDAFSDARGTFISNGTVQGDLVFGDGDDIFVQRGATSGVSGIINAGAGRDAYGRSHTSSGTIALGAALPPTFEDELFEATGDNVVLTLTGSNLAGTRTYVGGSGQFVNQADIGGAIVARGFGDGGAPTSFVNNGNIAQGLTGLVQRFTNNGFVGGTLAFGGTEGTTLVNTGEIDAAVSFGTGADMFDNRTGSLSGSVSMGDGDDRLIIGDAGFGTGDYYGGDGEDTLQFAGSAAGAPVILDQYLYSFERLAVSSGTLQLSGGRFYSEVAVDGGRFIGAAGSYLAADRITVAAGATFGSAGIVEGDLTVAGTLAPGASPGRMRIFGDVAFTPGSTALFEMTPTVSDAIIINGALTIAPGSTLRLTGMRPLTPGVAYNLITATDGITGRFTTIDKAASVLGYIRQSADKIELLGQFVFAPGVDADPQAKRVTDYLNDLLIGGTAANGILNAVPQLLDAGGFAVAGAMRRLGPEAYASASQIGVENGLMLASAARSMDMAGGHGGAFSFGQILGGRQTLARDSSIGTAEANLSAHGMMGGIGFGSSDATFGAFIGYIDARQRIGAIGAETDTDGVVAGLIGRSQLAGADMSVMIAWDGSQAHTRRALPGGSAARSRYTLHGWTLDARLGYAFDLGGGLNLRPEVGITHIASKRTGATETGGDALALDLEGRTTDATFLSGALTVKTDPESRLQSWLSVGLRHQASGSAVFASAAFAGVTPGLTVPGAPRDRTLATVSAGISAAVSPAARLFIGTAGAFGADSDGQSVNAGVNIRF